MSFLLESQRSQQHLDPKKKKNLLPTPVLDPTPAMEGRRPKRQANKPTRYDDAPSPPPSAERCSSHTGPGSADDTSSVRPTKKQRAAEAGGVAGPSNRVAPQDMARPAFPVPLAEAVVGATVAGFPPEPFPAPFPARERSSSITRSVPPSSLPIGSTTTTITTVTTVTTVLSPPPASFPKPPALPQPRTFPQPSSFPQPPARPPSALPQPPSLYGTAFSSTMRAATTKAVPPPPFVPSFPHAPARPAPKVRATTITRLDKGKGKEEGQGQLEGKSAVESKSVLKGKGKAVVAVSAPRKPLAVGDTTTPLKDVRKKPKSEVTALPKIKKVFTTPALSKVVPAPGSGKIFSSPITSKVAQKESGPSKTSTLLEELLNKGFKKPMAPGGQKRVSEASQVSLVSVSAEARTAALHSRRVAEQATVAGYSVGAFDLNEQRNGMNQFEIIARA